MEELEEGILTYTCALHMHLYGWVGPPYHCSFSFQEEKGLKRKL